MQAKGYELLKGYIKDIIPEFPEAELEQFFNLFHHKKFNRSEFLLKQGEYAKCEGFVIEGCFRIYTVNKKGEDYTLYFAMKNWWTVDLNSFTNHLPSNLNIQAVENSEILWISRDNKEKALRNIPSLDKLFRIMSQDWLINNQKRILDQYSLSAEERYLKFLDDYEGVSPLVTNKQIASYIGVSPEYISRIKRKNIKTIDVDQS